MRGRTGPPVAGKRPMALAAGLFAVVVWGASFAVTRAAVREVPPLTLAFLRFFLAAAILWPLGGRKGPRPSAADRLAIAALGFTGVTLYFAFENFGLQYTTASHGALIVATIPLATELVFARRAHRAPAPAVLAGLFAALAGVALIFGRDAGGGAGAVGDLLMLGAVASWVGYTLIAERLVPRFPGLYLTGQIMTVGAVTLFPGALIELWLAPVSFPSAAAWAGIGFLGVFCSALGYLAWNYALPVLGVATTNLLIYLIPLVGVLAGVLSLGEPLTGRIVAGGLLIVGGVAWAGWRQQRR